MRWLVGFFSAGCRPKIDGPKTNEMWKRHVGFVFSAARKLPSPTEAKAKQSQASGVARQGKARQEAWPLNSDIVKSPAANCENPQTQFKFWLFDSKGEAFFSISSLLNQKLEKNFPLEFDFSLSSYIWPNTRGSLSLLSFCFLSIQLPNIENLFLFRFLFSF